MIVVHCQIGEPQGHYFACPECGWCSRVYQGDDSRLRAVVAAQEHYKIKAATRDEQR